MKEKGASPLFQVSRATLHETRQFTTVFVPTEATEEDALGLVAAAIRQWGTHHLQGQDSTLFDLTEAKNGATLTCDISTESTDEGEV